MSDPKGRCFSPLLLDSKELARLLSISPATVWRLDSAGKIPRPLKLGGSTRWRFEEIEEWIDVEMPDRKTWQEMQLEAEK